MRPKAIVLSLLLLVPGSAWAETYLLMAEEPGCIWCARWNTEIGPIYPKTAEGQTAPLRRFNLHSEKPDVTFRYPVRITPTFILVRDGAELERIEGYPGEDFFWGLLGMMLDRAKIPLKEKS